MLVLDTDHLVEFQKGTSPEAIHLSRRLFQSTDRIATTIITVEEVMRGWLGAIRRFSEPSRQVDSYRRFRESFEFFSTLDVLDWNREAAGHFQQLRNEKVRIGTMDLKIASVCMDLKIASVCLTYRATLLTRNRVDFERVPGLSFENWLSE